jgi:ATP-dependent exoDNAse (exonuclease V) alpha subunit
VQFTRTDGRVGVQNGTTGIIEAIDGTNLAVRLAGPESKVINFDAASWGHFRHGYAGTVYKGQGDTLDQTYS